MQGQEESRQKKKEITIETFPAPPRSSTPRSTDRACFTAPRGRQGNPCRCFLPSTADGRFPSFPPAFAKNSSWE